MTATSAIVATAQAALQHWLSIKPLPMYIERSIHRTQAMTQLEWQKILDIINPELPDFLKEDHVILRLADPIAIAEIIELEFTKSIETLNSVIPSLQEVIRGEHGETSEEERRAAILCLASLFTEGIVEWEKTVRPEVALDATAVSFREIELVCSQALASAFCGKNLKMIAQAAYDMGRVLHRLNKHPKSAVAILDVALRCMYSSVAVQKAEQTERWWSMRLDILQRLVYLCSRNTALRQYLDVYSDCLNFPQIAAFPRHSGENEFDLAGGYVSGLKWDPPDKVEAYSELPHNTAYLSLTSSFVETTVEIVSRPEKGKARGGIGTISPVSTHIGAWDRFFRPAFVDFSIRVRNTLSERPRIFAFGWAPPGDEPEENRLDHRLEYTVGYDVLVARPSSAADVHFALTHEIELLHESNGWNGDLYERIFSPIGTYCNRYRHLIVNAGGGLRLLPFHLLSPKPGTYLCEKFDISYVMNSAWVSRYAAADRKNWPRSILVVGDSTGSLPFSDTEIRMIRSVASDMPITILESEKATPDAIRQLIQDFDIVHFCCHATFNSDDISRSGLHLAGGVVLNCEEIEALPMKPGNLIFLSACETARCRLSVKPDRTGIVASFLIAGAATVVASFWEVEDLSTALLVREFYRFLTRSGGCLRALNQAERWLRILRRSAIKELLPNVDLRNVQRPFANPFYWGAFGLFGAWK